MQTTSAFLMTISLSFVLMTTSVTPSMAFCLMPIFFIACFIWRSFILIPAMEPQSSFLLFN